MPLALDRPRKSKKSVLSGNISRTDGKNLMELELLAAKEILAEVFDITFAEAEEMIRQRSLERTIWPERFGDNDISL